MGLPEESKPHDACGLTQLPTEREPVPPPDWAEESAEVQPPAHYRILEALKGGGMGVIYKAEDTRLRRIVALKFLPRRFTNDAVAKARFLQEARAASALDHQNICTIFDIGETEDGQLYISMPWYEGETLRLRLAEGPLPVEEALDIARQIARGLIKAHRQGIVHRDIKPENLMVTTEGVVKILDFGIAKLTGAADLTGTEHRIGTPAYMAPEQSQKGGVDHRADLWSLGVVLYEMVTGRRPFRGANPVAVLQAIHYGVPEPISRLRHGTPARLEKIVARLLMKNPKARYPDAEALLADLDGRQAADDTRSRRVWLTAGIAALAGIGLIATELVEPGDSAEGAGAVRASFRQLTTQSGAEWYPSLDPDGGRFAYVKWYGTDYDIFLQDLDGGAPVNLTEAFPGDDTHPAFSPDGKQIAFRSERPDGGGIFLMTLTGEKRGPVRRLTDFGYSPAWSPDGREILVATAGITDPTQRERSSRIWRIDVATRKPQLLLDRDGVQPSWSPDGRRIAYWSVLAKNGRRVLWTVSADGRGKPVPVALDRALDWNPVWSSDGYLYFASDRNGVMSPWRIALDMDTGQVLGEPQPIASSRWSGFLSLSADGQRLLYATSEPGTFVERAELSPDGLSVTGSPVPVAGGSTDIRQARVSPGGDRIVFVDSSTDNEEDLFLAPADRTGEVVQITRDTHRDRSAVWLPDGSIVFSSNRGGRYELWTAGPDGGGPRRLAVSHEKPLFHPVPSPDGRRLACLLGLDQAALVALGGVPEPLPPVNGSTFVASSWSPDGRHLAGTVNGTPGVFLYSLTTRRYERLTKSGWRPVWMDGSKILFLDEGWKVASLDLGTRERHEVLAPPPGSFFIDMDLHPERRILYLVRQKSEGDIQMSVLE